MSAMENLKGPGAAVSYQPFEKAFRDFTCSLIEHQNLMEEHLNLRIAELRQQVDALERTAGQDRPAPAGDPEAGA